MNKQQEDFILESARERDFENKITQTEVIYQKPICVFCGEKKGTKSITDGETNRELLICVECDSQMNLRNS